MTESELADTLWYILYEAVTKKMNENALIAYSEKCAKNLIKTLNRLGDKTKELGL